MNLKTSKPQNLKTFKKVRK